MILPHLSASARVNVASSSGLDLAVSTAMSSIRFFTSGRNRIRPISALSLETISFDKPAGPLSFPKIPSLRFAHERAAEVLAKVLAGDQADEAETLNTFKELLRLRQVAEECAKDAAPYILRGCPLCVIVDLTAKALSHCWRCCRKSMARRGGRQTRQRPFKGGDFFKWQWTCGP